MASTVYPWTFVTANVPEPERFNYYEVDYSLLQQPTPRQRQHFRSYDFSNSFPSCRKHQLMNFIKRFRERPTILVTLHRYAVHLNLLVDSLLNKVDNTQDRYASFLRMMREWRHLLMMKRAGRCHDPSSIAGTKQGECAVLCPACPQPGKNLPDDWETKPINQR